MRTELQLVSYPVNNEDFTDTKLLLELLGSYCYRIEVTEPPEIQKADRQELNNHSTNILHKKRFLYFFLESSLLFLACAKFQSCMLLISKKKDIKSVLIFLNIQLSSFYCKHLHWI